MSATTLAVKKLHTNFKMTFTNINHHCLVLVEQFNKRKNDIYWLPEVKISICFSIKIKTNKKNKISTVCKWCINDNWKLAISIGQTCKPFGLWSDTNIPEEGSIVSQFPCCSFSVKPEFCTKPTRVQWIYYSWFLRGTLSSEATSVHVGTALSWIKVDTVGAGMTSAGERQHQIPETLLPPFFSNFFQRLQLTLKRNRLW